MDYNKFARQALDKAKEDAITCHQRYIGTEHIVLGLLSSQDSLAGKVLEECELT